MKQLVIVSCAMALAVSTTIAANFAVKLQISNCSTGSFVSTNTAAESVNGEIELIQVINSGDTTTYTNVLTFATVASGELVAKTLLSFTNTADATYYPKMATLNNSGETTAHYRASVPSQAIRLTGTGANKTNENITAYVIYTR